MLSVTERPPGSRKYIFPPGHHSLINDFINKIKRELNLKRSLNSTNHSDPKRKKQQDQPTETSSKPLHDLNEMSDNVRKRIIKWQRNQTSDSLKKIKEHTDYTVICKLDKLNCPVVSIQCMLCSKIYQLYCKGEYYDNDTMMLSNWTKHIKAMMKQKHKEIVESKHH